MAAQPRGDSLGQLAMIIVIALVIVILAFFFTVPNHGQYAVIGAPNGEETSPIVIRQSNGYSERLNTSTRNQDTRAPIVRENGLSSLTIPD